jgi:Flp pilus assembly pilin Flp
MGSQRGAASVEHAGLLLLIALVLAGVGGAALSNRTDSAERELARAVAQKLRCAAQGPGPCWQDPLTEAYGRPLAGVVRALAPLPRAAGPSGLLPVDFRRCRQASCAAPGERPELTASNRRVTAFVTVRDERRANGTVSIDYWLYRPTMGWEQLTRSAAAADVTRYASTPLLDADNPRLVPLETLAGRNHVRFPPAEEPPWRWRIAHGPP